MELLQRNGCIQVKGRVSLEWPVTINSKETIKDGWVTTKGPRSQSEGTSAGQSWGNLGIKIKFQKQQCLDTL